jgi:hypothetical protein
MLVRIAYRVRALQMKVFSHCCERARWDKIYPAFEVATGEFGYMKAPSKKIL